MYHPLEKRRRILAPLLISLGTLLVAGYATIKLAERFFLLAWSADHEIPISMWRLFCFTIKQIGTAIATLPFTSQHPLVYVGTLAAFVTQALDRVDMAERSYDTFAMLAISTLVPASLAFCVGRRSMPKQSRVRHISGRKLVMNRCARRFVARAERRARKHTGAGLFLAPGLQMSRERETRHFLLMAATGGGKTVIMRFLLRQMIERGDRLLLHDTKGDYTAGILGPFTLLAPHDRRSAAWDIAADIVTAQDAREFAAAFIPASQDPIWSNGAREILTGCIVTLQSLWGRDWGWNDLAGLVFCKPAELRALLLQNCPTAAVYVEIDANSALTKLGFSFLVTLWAHAGSTLIPLAKAWPKDSRAAFSARAWLKQDNPNGRTVVMQRAAHLPALSTAWTAALVQVLARTAAGPELPDDPQRRIFLMLDEFPQLGKLEGFGQLLEAGRSRGVSAVMAVQDLSQLIDIYGQAKADTWQSLVGTTIIGRTGPGKTARMICDTLIGKRRVSWRTRSISWAEAKLDGSGGGTTRSRQIESHVVDVVDPADLESALGLRYSGARAEIRAFIVGIGDGSRQAVLEGVWPIEDWPEQRQPSEPAPWLHS